MGTLLQKRIGLEIEVVAFTRAASYIYYIIISDRASAARTQRIISGPLRARQCGNIALRADRDDKALDRRATSAATFAVCASLIHKVKGTSAARSLIVYVFFFFSTFLLLRTFFLCTRRCETV